MSLLLREIKIEWDEKDPTRIIVSFANVDCNFDAASARKLGKALIEMARRSDERIADALRSVERSSGPTQSQRSA